jgi:hypothetical protein
MFRNPYIIGLLCVVFVLLLWIPALFPSFGILTEPTTAPFQSHIVKILLLHEQTGIFINILFTALTAFCLFVSNQRHHFIAEREYRYLLPILYVILSAAIPESQPFSGAHIASLFFMMGIHYLCNIIYTRQALPAIFFASFFVTLAGLLYFPIYITLIAVFVGIIIFKPLSWRDWTTFLVGIAVPYFYVFLWLYLTGELSQGYPQFITGKIITFRLPDFTYSELPFCILLTVISLWALFPIRTSDASTKIKAAKMRKIINFLLLLLIIAGLLCTPSFSSMMPLISIPLSIIITNFYECTRRKKIINVLLFLLFLSILIMRTTLI